MNSVKNSVCGSRRMCSSSLRATENVRQRGSEPFMASLVQRLRQFALAGCARCVTNTSSRLAPAGRMSTLGPAEVGQRRRRRRPGRGSTGRRSSPRGRSAGACSRASSSAVSGATISSRRQPAGVTSGSCFSSLGRAEGQQLAQVQIADAAAALGLVHVVRGDEQRDALRRPGETAGPTARGGPPGRCRPSARRGRPAAAGAAGHTPAPAAASSRRRACRPSGRGTAPGRSARPAPPAAAWPATFGRP